MKNMYHRLKIALEQDLGIRFYFRGTPRGLDLFNDIERWRPGFAPTTVLDIGANVGQTALSLRKRWKDAEIHAFEPVQKTFRTLERNIAGQRIACHRMAFSDTAGEAEMTVMENGVLSSLENDVFFATDKTEGTERVRTERLDDWLEDNKISHVDFLKIDTEGHDIHVLKGAERLISEGRVAFVLVEEWMTTWKGVSQFETLHHLTERGYRLLSLLEQEAYPFKEQFFCNMLFAHHMN